MNATWEARMLRTSLRSGNGRKIGNGMSCRSPLDWICLPAFARFRCFLGARWSKRNGRNGLLRSGRGNMFAPRYHNYCFDITAFYHNNRSDSLHIQSLNDFPRICICRCINLSCIALHERREAKTHRPASLKAAREPGYDKLPQTAGSARAP